ncbi:MAG: D-alanyl-D-alanine carboxypeptidase family protein [Candidatus Competibacteraceae bacterium]|jgi:D-alanyl-D-alanine carboxypeptidase (penicillin-binding protein 5/6)|nr:D-alanyl-D-alanine carboxypeptidase family protein [Candidatus Competibacteraceae bacterium]
MPVIGFLFLLVPFFVLSPALAQVTPAVPELPVRHYLLMDFHSGRLLAESGGDERAEPASITKLMTGYIVYKNLREGHIKSDDLVTISENAWRTGGSRMFVELGSKVPVEDLIMGMVVQSGNDATVALAEYIAGSESAFAALMNQQAAELGLTGSHFMNATGWPDPEHYMTTRDIAMLAYSLIRDFPDEYVKYSVQSFTYNNITQYNRNRLLTQDPSVDGIKTGHTESAGYCLAASAKREDMRLISVVLGADKKRDRFSASQTLLNHGFRFFETHKLYDGNQPLTEVRVWAGETNELPIGLQQTLYTTVPRGRYEEMKAALRVNPNIEAPVQKGMQLGSVVVTLGDETITEVPLVALENVAEAGFFGRIYDQAMRAVYSLFD